VRLGSRARVIVMSASSQVLPKLWVAVKCEAWRRDYNEVRPHSVISDLAPTNAPDLI
jgi:transposase InsO family protein